MTISATTARWSYTGDGATVAFAYDNLIFAAGDLKVYVAGALKALGADYSVSGAGVPTGGTVTFTVAPANGAAVAIVRDVAATQPTDYVENDPFPAGAHEQALDRLTVVAQQTDARVRRAVRLDDADPTSELVLPLAASRAGKFLGFSNDAAATPIASAGPVAGVPVSLFMETVLDDTTAAAARATLAAAALGANSFTGVQTLSGVSLVDANASVAANATASAIWLLGNYVTLTGAAVTFTDFADAPQAGAEVELFCNAAHIFTDNANLEIDGDASFTAEAGDRILVRAKSTTVFTLQPRKKTGGWRNPTVQVFTGTGTWTKPAGLKAVEIEVQGGGGGGRGSAAGAGNGGAGGTSSFGAHASATGGGGGTGGMIAGGVGSGGNLNLTGGNGGSGNGIASSPGGNGGNGPFGGAAGVTGNSAAGVAGTTNTGGGGGGGGGDPTNGSGGGGGGGGYARKLIAAAALGATEAVTIGPAGAAGAGTFVGGAGGSGLIVVREYY